MLRTFSYNFLPQASAPVAGATLQLDTDDIETAALAEVLQTPGATVGTWALLDALLEPTGPGTPFQFREPLGQAREVKVALSGLLGRFVARAYLTRHHDLAFFAHLGPPSVTLNGRLKAHVSKKKGERGDFPDWLAASSALTNLTVAEAKGCHDPAGALAARRRAWDQANRVDVFVANAKAPTKRIAVATRWGCNNSKLARPEMAVRDPEDVGDKLTKEQRQAIYIGLARLHVASLLKPLGFSEMAKLIRDATRSTMRQIEDRAVQSARNILNDTPNAIADDDTSHAGVAVIGGYVTRSGPLPRAEVSAADRALLERLNLRPTFVGIERSLIEAVIIGDFDTIVGTLSSDGTRPARPGGAGTWIVAARRSPGAERL